MNNDDKAERQRVNARGMAIVLPFVLCGVMFGVGFLIGGPADEASMLPLPFVCGALGLLFGIIASVAIAASSGGHR